MESQIEAAEILVSFRCTRWCENCKTTSTPMWRWIEDILMCNACAIHVRKYGSLRPTTFKDIGF